MFTTAVTAWHPPTISPLVYFSPCKRCYSYPGFIGELGPINELAQGYMVKEQGQDSNSGLPGSKFYPLTAIPHGPVSWLRSAWWKCRLDLFKQPLAPRDPDVSAEWRPSHTKPGSDLFRHLLSSYCVPGPVLNTVPR